MSHHGVSSGVEGIQIDWWEKIEKGVMPDLESQSNGGLPKIEKIEMPVLEAHVGLIQRNKGENVHCGWMEPFDVNPTHRDHFETHFLTIFTFSHNLHIFILTEVINPFLDRVDSKAPPNIYQP